MRALVCILVLIWAFVLKVEANKDITATDRGIADIWDAIKKTVQNALNAIKDLAEKTKDKINKWMEAMKDRAKEIGQKFKEKVNDMKEKSKQILEDLVGKEAAQKIQECFEKESGVEALLRQLIQNVTMCISESIHNLRYPDHNVFKLEIDNLNEAELLSELEIKIKNCFKVNDTTLCLNQARNDILNYMDRMENTILTDRVVLRGIIDDLFEKALLCTSEGLIEASHIIAADTLRVFACVVKK